MKTALYSVLASSTLLLSGAFAADDHANSKNEMKKDEMNAEVMNSSEFSMLDVNDNGVVTSEEYVQVTTQFDNITEDEAMSLFDLTAGDDDELSRAEFLDPENDYDERFAAALLD
ncbi:hypothetical protein PB2503_07207 [Parvularcula bermudensis HTCC2503]|uniref:EF-hand domain-containing protein n=1 Tax=Parvularcula bermudensis (strain ATCC BAA-594 / HTCC2503 / KCTC 12087) TaxID=314260 RepID=E0TET5_PARBH|nr:hypothetical protein [Parvularcula bermudensis]ADM09507.1 hypothetical protein PB2503_07207 [Parvularcula bermudensis HTCC2503]